MKISNQLNKMSNKAISMNLQGTKQENLQAISQLRNAHPDIPVLSYPQLNLQGNGRETRTVILGEKDDSGVNLQGKSIPARDYNIINTPLPLRRLNTSEQLLLNYHK